MPRFYSILFVLSAVVPLPLMATETLAAFECHDPAAPFDGNPNRILARLQRVEGTSTASVNSEGLLSAPRGVGDPVFAAHNGIKISGHTLMLSKLEDPNENYAIVLNFPVSGSRTEVQTYVNGRAFVHYQMQCAPVANDQGQTLSITEFLAHLDGPS